MRWLHGCLATLFSLRQLTLTDANDVSVGPALPGDKNYWVKLKGLELSSGELTPEFHPDVESYSVIVSNEDIVELVITPELDIGKYNLLHTPTIKLDGEEVNYSPLNTIQLDVRLDENTDGDPSIGPVDRDVIVEISDPNGGYFASKMAYTIHVRQPPDFEKVILAQGLVVTDNHNEEIRSVPPFEAGSAETNYKFDLGIHVESVVVELSCAECATGLTYDGQAEALGSVHHLDVHGATNTLVVQCKYKSDEWTHGSDLQRTYVLTFERNAHLQGTFIELLIMPGQGECSQKNPEVWTEGWNCHSGMHSPEFIAEFNNSNAELSMFRADSQTKHRLYNGLPVAIPIPEADHTAFEVLLEAGSHQRVFPLDVTFDEKTLPTTTPPPPPSKQEHTTAPPVPHPHPVWELTTPKPEFGFSSLQMRVRPRDDEGACAEIDETFVCKVKQAVVHLSIFYHMGSNVPGKVEVGGVNIENHEVQMHLHELLVPTDTNQARHVTLMLHANGMPGTDKSIKLDVWLHYVGPDGDTSLSRRLSSTDADIAGDTMDTRNRDAHGREPVILHFNASSGEQLQADIELHNRINSAFVPGLDHAELFV